MKPSLAAFAAILLLSPIPAFAAPAPADLTAALRAKDQALLDAIAPGDRGLWDRTLTPDAQYVDENGTIMTRAKFLEELQPLPAGASGHLAIVDYQVDVDGDTAVAIIRSDERETYHGQALKAGYLMTETWLKRGGDWKLALVHAYVINNDPPAQAVASAALDAYVGRYQAGPDFIYAIKREGDGLMGGVEGRPPKAILVESGDVLFTAGQPRNRKIFSRDAQGRVTGFVDRREGGDLTWTRLP